MQRLRRLLRQRSERRAEKAFVVEGVKVLDEALAAGAPFEALYYAPEALDSPAASALLGRAGAAGIRVYALGRGVIERVADATTPQPVCGVVSSLDVPLESLGSAALLLVCVDVRDPGNLGAILRSADAAGADGVVVCAGSADPFNPKTVRSTAGSIFHVPLALGAEAPAVLERLGELGLRRLGASVHGGTDYALADFSGRVALVLGNEANGLDAAAEACLDERLSVPMAGRAESLNVAMAATLLVFEATRRRRLSGR